jgi:hypothetical protein
MTEKHSVQESINGELLNRRNAHPSLQTAVALQGSPHHPVIPDAHTQPNCHHFPSPSTTGLSKNSSSAAQQGAVLERPCSPKNRVPVKTESLSHGVCASRMHVFSAHSVQHTHNTHTHPLYNNIFRFMPHTPAPLMSKHVPCVTSNSHTTAAYTLWRTAAVVRSVACAHALARAPQTTDKGQITHTRTANLAHSNTGLFTHTCDVATAQGTVVRRPACRWDCLAGGRPRPRSCPCTQRTGRQHKTAGRLPNMPVVCIFCGPRQASPR